MIGYFINVSSVYIQFLIMLKLENVEQNMQFILKQPSFFNLENLKGLKSALVIALRIYV